MVSSGDSRGFWEEEELCFRKEKVFRREWSFSCVEVEFVEICLVYLRIWR